MHCELAIPGLLAAARQLRLPSAELLLARGRRSEPPAQPLEGWLAEGFGLDSASFPAGALTLLGRGIEPGGGRWARADPVHLHLLRDRIALIPAEAFDVTADEAQALCGALNAHFAGRLRLDALEPRRWCARLDERGELAAEASPAALAGQDLRPGGPGDALANEMQMALHGHPVNEAREARGAPAVNGVWLWGGGAAPKEAHSAWDSVTADDPAALGLARLAAQRGRALPASAEALLERLPEEGRHLVLLDGLRVPLALGETEALARGLEELEQRWFQPLLAALRAGRIGMLTVHVPDAGRAFETIRGDLRRFWRRPRPLATMAP
ncbi:MAG: hypothetical protein ACM30H_10090 [Clostridia bacterium]